jgi:hypothetical protein
MSPDSLTPIGPSQFDAILAPHEGPDAAAVLNADDLAVLEGGRQIEGAFFSVFVIDAGTFDPNEKFASGVLPPSGISLGQATPADSFSVSGSIAAQPGAGAMVIVNASDLVFPSDMLQQNAYFEALPVGGASSGMQMLGIPGDTFGAVVFPGPAGFHLEWVTGTDATGFTLWQEDVTATGAPLAGTLTQAEGAGPISYAGLILNGAAFSIEDNIAELAGAAAVAIPGEPAHAVTQVAAAALADGTHAAVGWVDSGTDYGSLFDSASDSFGPVIGLDWGGASDLHLVALPDGGFVASWMNGGAYKGEVFAADGTGGGVIPLAGDVMGLTSSGALLTLNHSTFQGQLYQIDPGQLVSTSDARYTAPDGVGTIILSGANQTVMGNNAGDVIWSNDTGSALIGGTENDTFYIGRGGDWVLGNGGADVFKFDAIPWAGAHILDFTPGDALDLTLMLATVYPLPDPIGAGYVKLTDDGAGNAQVWADYHIPGNDGWWLVATLDGVSFSGLHYANGLIT